LRLGRSGSGGTDHLRHEIFRASQIHRTTQADALQREE